MFRKLSASEKEYVRDKRRAEHQRLVARTEADTLLLLFTFVAGADGALSDREVSHYSSFMAECSRCEVVGLTRVDPDAATPTLRDMVAQLRRHMSICRPTVAWRRKVLRALDRLAACDHVVNQDESLALSEVRRLFQLSSTRESARGQTNRFAGRANGAAERDGQATSNTRGRASRAVADMPADAHWCYDVLGCSQHDSDDVVKSAYRRLALLLHPDKHSARAKSPDQVRAHQQEFQRLQEAYDEIKRLRGA